MSAPNTAAATALRERGYHLLAGPERGNWRTDLVFKDGGTSDRPIGELTTNVNDGTARLDRGRQASMPEWKALAESLGARASHDIRFKA